MTGRGAGRCAGNAAPGYTSSGGGRFFGAGRQGGGGGRGFRRWFNATGLPGWLRFGGSANSASNVTKEEEIDLLKQQSEYFGKSLEEINARLERLQKEN